MHSLIRNIFDNRQNQMLTPEDIYDLDTITLEQKTDELEKRISSLPHAPKGWLSTLQLAKLEISERRAIEMFGLGLEDQFKTFQQMCLYPESEQPDLPIEVNQYNNKEHAQQKIVKLVSAKNNAKHIEKSVAELLKSTKIDSLNFVVGKSSVKSTVNMSMNKKKISVTKPNESVRQLQKLPSIRGSRKKIVSEFQIPKPKPEKLISTRDFVTKEIKKNTQNQPVHQNKQNIEALKIVKEKQQEILTKKSPIKNNLKFIENDIYTDSDQQIEFKQIRLEQQPQVKEKQEASKSKIQNMVQNDQIHQKVQQPILDQTEQKIYQEEIQQKIQVQYKPIKDQRIEKQIFKSQFKDKFDYFRLTVPKKKKLSEQQQQIVSKISEQSFLSETSQKNNQIQPIHVKNEQQQKIIQKTEKSTTQHSQHLHQSEKQQTRFIMQNQIKTKSITLVSMTKKVPSLQRNIMLQKILQQLPDILTQYHQIIPTFNHLFHPEAEPITLLRELISMFKQHFNLVTPSQHFCPNLFKNGAQFQTYLHQHSNKIKLYGNKVDLDLTNFQWKDQISKLRANGQVQIPPQHDILYYRVVKTKQEVYDIISSTFNRTSDWAQLPHGMNLKSTWNLLWTWAKPQIDFKKLFFFQKVNHFNHNKNLSRKDMLKKNIQKMRRLGSKTHQLFDIMPESYLLPGENTAFIERYYFYKEKEGARNLWIMKPIGQSRGRGISLIKSMDQVIYSEPVVLQKYLKNPLLLDGYKFDMRIYVLVTSINPLEVFLYKEGFARLSTEKYTLNTSDLCNNFIHLTNFAIQRENFIKQGFSLGGTKLSLKMLRQRLQAMKIDWRTIWNQVIEIVLKSTIASMNQIPQNNNCFQLFGYDIIIDDSLKCWLLQINSSPSLEREYVLDQIVKQQLTDDTISVIGAVKYDRKRLIEVFERRVQQYEGRKSVINTNNHSILQLNRDLHYILHGKPLRKYGQAVGTNNYEMIAPSDLYYSIVKIVQSYKLSNVIRK